jgi:putative transcriptional regulator
MINSVLDLSFSNQLKPKKGRLLLSDPFLGDEHFERSVVYLCEHSKEGSFGFVLNKYVEININELNHDFPNIVTRLSIGGPVEKESLYFLHTIGNELNDSLELQKGVFIGGDFDQLTKYVSESHFKENKIRFFLGYSGWDPKQLEEEIKNNSWIVATIDSIEELMDTSIDDPWKYFMSKLGNKYKLMTEFPLDPNEN